MQGLLRVRDGLQADIRAGEEKFTKFKREYDHMEGEWSHFKQSLANALMKIDRFEEYKAEALALADQRRIMEVLGIMLLRG